MCVNGTDSTPEFPPGVQRLPATAPPEHFIALLKRDGGVIIEGFASTDVIDKCNAEIRPKLEAEQRWSGDFFPVRHLAYLRPKLGLTKNNSIIERNKEVYFPHCQQSNLYKRASHESSLPRSLRPLSHHTEFLLVG